MIRQAGLGLVELMVALLIGSLILLGAGEVFQLVRGQFERISQLSQRQANLSFFANRVLGDIRRADSVDVSGTDPLTLSIDGESVDYRVDADTEQLLRNGEVMFDGLADEAGAFGVTSAGDSTYQVTLNLDPGGAGDADHSTFTFLVTNRAAAIKAAQENGNSQGGSPGSSGGNGSICQGPPWGKGGKPKECK
ncbi:PilW family protein [Modicisalibacter tunisiensis]|uniref:Prepilin-type N-terminal cleavage/methylation domain-containing protein n=1 Tax=Modicisalibacter tunisiensis TaxID=390637 RepID=A0ABS7WXV1_9GAMM|nr:prepilin-type N-terminal cleavage/methylation domain-containing protein [Modicisalibacter tunisiensis]MBZ9566587.1 prepilin-type N-terminal cleavage/methylation domain-containing protein [Modicisalibacter tunisiensis]